MARDINDTVVLGFGTWSDLNALPTLGFAVGAAPVVTPAYTPLVCDLQLQVYGLDLRLQNHECDLKLRECCP